MSCIDERFTILVDMDDTIENLAEAWNNYLNKRHNLSVKLSDWTDWVLTEHFPMLTEEQCFEPLFLPEFWKTVTPKPDARKYLKKLWDKGFPIYIVTASHPDTVAPKIKSVLNKYFPFIDYQHIIICSKKQLLSGWYLIDDGAHNFGGNYKGILFNNPWNTKINEKKLNVTRCYDWKEIYNKLMEEYKNLSLLVDNS